MGFIEEFWNSSYHIINLFFILTLFLFFLANVFALKVLTKYKSKRVWITMFGYLCYNFWALTSFISIYLPIDNLSVQRYNIAITIFLIIGSITLVYNKFSQNNVIQGMLKAISIIVGSIIMGLILVPVIYPSITYVKVTKIDGLIPKSELDKPMLIFGSIWGLITLIIIRTTGPNLADWKKSTLGEKIYITGKISLILGALIFIVGFFLTSFTLLYSILFIINRMVVLISVNLIFYALLVEPERTFSFSRALIKMIEDEEISVISTHLTDIGTEILHFMGLKFVEEKEDKIFLIENISILGLTLQGTGIKKKLNQASAIITVPGTEKYATLILTEWIDTERIQEQSQSLSYICLLIIIPKDFEYLLLNRKYWEASFDDFVKNIDTISDYPGEEKIIEFVKDRFIHIALNL